MSSKKDIRKRFRDACFSRDEFCCAKCGFKSSKEKAEQELDAHHITSRKDMPNGGYVSENGISLCSECHIKAEECRQGYSASELYSIINSNYDKAVKASTKLSIL